jgi:hypothetical protein
MPQVVEDMRRGTVCATVRRVGSARHHARAGAPLGPDRPGHYVTMSVQFSRGCPFDCEFCDIVVMNGRVPRTKSPSQLIAELEQLRLHGWQDMVFVVDDNFIGNKKQAKMHCSGNSFVGGRALGAKMVFHDRGLGQRGRRPGTVRPHGACRFQEGLRRVRDAVDESLEECRKLQNCGRDLVETVETLQRAGLEVMGGFIVGFDTTRWTSSNASSSSFNAPAWSRPWWDS